MRASHTAIDDTPYAAARAMTRTPLFIYDAPRRRAPMPLCERKIDYRCRDYSYA